MSTVITCTATEYDDYVLLTDLELGTVDFRGFNILYNIATF